MEVGSQVALQEGITKSQGFSGRALFMPGGKTRRRAVYVCVCVLAAEKLIFGLPAMIRGLLSHRECCL